MMLRRRRSKAERVFQQAMRRHERRLRDMSGTYGDYCASYADHFRDVRLYTIQRTPFAEQRLRSHRDWCDLRYAARTLRLNGEWPGATTVAYLYERAAEAVDRYTTALNEGRA